MDEEFESLCPFCIIQKKGTGENPDTFPGAEGETRTLAPVTRPTPLAGAPRHQLEYFCIGSVYDTIRLLKERAENPLSLLSGGESGIRTHGTLPYGSFQDCFLKPLGHLSLWTLALRRVECLFTLPDLRRSVKPLCKFFFFLYDSCTAGAFVTTFIRSFFGFSLYRNTLLLYNKTNINHPLGKGASSCRFQSY